MAHNQEWVKLAAQPPSSLVWVAGWRHGNRYQGHEQNKTGRMTLLEKAQVTQDGSSLRLSGVRLADPWQSLIFPPTFSFTVSTHTNRPEYKNLDLRTF